MEVLIIILSLAFLLLNVILFFKIWGMTNDVAAIRQLLQNNNLLPKETQVSAGSNANPQAQPVQVSPEEIEKEQERKLDNIIAAVVAIIFVFGIALLVIFVS